MNRIEIAFSEYRFIFSRSAGAGGQHVNKTNTKVTMYWNPLASENFSADFLTKFKQKYPQYVLDDGQIQITCQEHRSQKRNQEECIKKLHHLIEEVLKPVKPRKATKPKRSAILKRLDSKERNSKKKQLRSKNYK